MEINTEYKIVVDIGDNPPILLLNGKVAMTHFDSETRQLFEVENLGSFIYFKNVIKLHKVSIEKYNKLLIKLIDFVGTRDVDTRSRTQY